MLPLIRTSMLVWGINLSLVPVIFSQTEFIVKDHQPQGRIVVGVKAPSATKFAAKELQSYIKRATDAELPLCNEVKDDNIPEIIVDNGEIAHSLGVDVNELPRDGFYIRRIGKRLVIAGRDELKTDMEKWLESLSPSETFFEFGTGFGVYEFLERYLGIRWYLPGQLGEVVPKRKDLVLPDVDITVTPDKTFRFIHPAYGADDKGDPLPRNDRGGWIPAFKGDAEKAFNRTRKLQFLRMRHQTTPNIDSHNLGRLIPPDKYEKTHPEYFATLADGSKGANMACPNISQYCYSCPGLADQLIKVVKAYMSGSPSKEVGVENWSRLAFEFRGKKVFNIQLGDGYRPCECEKCRKYRRGHMGEGAQVDADLVWNVIIKVAESVQTDFPNALISTALYGPIETLPSRRIPANIVIAGFARTGPYEEFIPELKKTEGETLKQVLNVFGKERISKFWIYPMLGGWENGRFKSKPFICASMPRSFGKYFQHYGNIGDGTYAYLLSHNYAFDHLNIYTFYKFHWNCGTDLDALLDEYYRLFYGPASVPMRKFWEEAETKSELITAKIVETPLGPISVHQDEDTLWGKIYSPETLQGWSACFEEAKKLAEKSDDPVYAKRIAHMKRNVLDIILDGAAEHRQIKEDVSRLISTNDVRNIVKNSDFTSVLAGGAPEGWSTPREKDMELGSSWLIDPDDSNGSEKSLKLHVSKGGKKLGLTQMLPKLEPNTDYFLTFSVRTDDIKPLSDKYAGAYVNIYDDKNHFYPAPSGFFYIGTTPWTRHEFKFKTGGGTNKKNQSYISICIMNAIGTVWFDEVKIIPITK